MKHQQPPAKRDIARLQTLRSGDRRGSYNACGMRGQPFEVYACALHGKCMIRRYRKTGPDLAACDDLEASQ